ncbi:hypothetical protein RhiJN_25768 [Ceratobasidium sp. AG-Ba]|nr:hypothetical protein RhiJN_25768 [Ceratobasidium sp. AG-Ba]
MGKEQFEATITSCGGKDAVKTALTSSTKMFSAGAIKALMDTLDIPKDQLEDDAILALQGSSEFRDKLLDAVCGNGYESMMEYISKVLPTPPEDDDLSFATAFKSTYYPGAELALFEYLRQCEEEYQDTSKRYYGRFCSVVQSSGTGKSRMLVELRRTGTLVLYMNIRGKDDGNSYPPRDPVPSQLLAENLDPSAEEYTTRCVAFFIALFRTLKRYLTRKFTTNHTREQVVEACSSTMCVMGNRTRASFFRHLSRESAKAMVELGYKPPEQLESIGIKIRSNDGASPSKIISPSVSGGSLVDVGQTKDAKGTECKGGDRYAADVSTKEKQGPQLVGEAMMAKAYRDLLSVHPGVIAAGRREPQLVIVLDEAHTLGKLHNDYLPSDALCRVISAFSTSQENLSIWTVFASTDPKVADFAVPVHTNPLSRITQGGSLLFAPYHGLGWDQRVLVFPGTRLREVGRFENIVRLGRPLWQSLVESGISPSLILDTACDKLCNEDSYDKTNREQALAVLGQRFILDISFKHYNGVDFSQNAVSSHLRYCFEISEDRSWLETSYPSEPMLSCAVTRILYSPPDMAHNTILDTALSHLQEAVVDDMIEVGQKGELVSRLVFLIAKDFALRQGGTAMTPHMDSDLTDCRPFPVVDYLDGLFGDEFLTPELKDRLNGWYINFSHWIQMTKPINFGEVVEQQIPKMEQWLASHWARTSAVQCCHLQSSFDKLIPMLKLGDRSAPYPEEDKLTGRVSFILISDEAKEASSKVTLSHISLENAGLPSINEPIIAILADLGLSDSSRTMSIGKDSNVIRIHASGLGPDVYHFLTKRPNIAQRLQEILHPMKPSGRMAGISEAVRRQPCFGSSVSNLNMKPGEVGS